MVNGYIGLMQSKYCRATTDYNTYAPYPDWIELNIDVTEFSWYSSCYSVKLELYRDGTSLGWTTVILNYTGVGQYNWTPSDPGDNDRHSYQCYLTCYTGSASGTILGRDWARNYYNPSSTYYYMQGHMGNFSITETRYDQTVSYLQPGTGYVNWYFKPTMSGSYPAIDVKHDFTYKYNNKSETSYTDYKSEEIGWAYWRDHDEYKNQLAPKAVGTFTLYGYFTYYDGYKDYSTGQYVPRTYKWNKAHTFTVYENVTKPLLDISSVYSSNINTGSQTVLDPAPYEGKAPYKVIWTAAATSTEHPYALPVSKIVWNFGDPDSGGQNQATTYYYSTTQTHTYPDYESRTCTITVTDAGSCNAAYESLYNQLKVLQSQYDKVFMESASVRESAQGTIDDNLFIPIS